MEITRPRTCNGNYTPRDLYCTPWESCGEGAYRNLLFYCRGVLTVLKSIHPRRGKKNEHYVELFRRSRTQTGAFEGSTNNGLICIIPATITQFQIAMAIEGTLDQQTS